MAYWLLKTEPTDYSFDQLLADGQTVWDGVGNNLALKHLRGMAKGDKAFVYHTGKEKAVVGTAAVASAPYADPASDDDKRVVVDLKAGKPLAAPVTLAAMKGDPMFEGFDLLRIGRLSVVPVPKAMWERIETLGRG